MNSSGTTGGAAQGGASSGGVAVQGGAPSSGGVPGSGGASSSGGSAGSPAALCPETVSVDSSSVLLHVPIELVAGGVPFSLNEEYAVDATKYVASELSFFLSGATLIRAGGERIQAHFADPSGAPRPYDVHLVRASDLASLSLDLLAPSGEYEALELGVGLPAACNRGDPTRAVYPLTASTGMYWVWATGYMFIRFEGSRQSTQAWTPFQYHVGFDLAYRTLTLTAPFAIPVTSPQRLVLDVTRVLSSSTVIGGDMHAVPDLEVADRFAAPGTVVLQP
jgi:hypothetical protein